MSAEIVSLCDMRAARAHPVLVQVEAYWDGLRDGRAAPARVEVDPRGLAGVLKHCFILEKIAPGLARFRVCGQHLNDLMGLEMKGMPFSTLFLPEARDVLEDTLDRVFSTPATTRLRVAGPSDFRRRRIEGRMLLLPLRSDLGDVSRILGCLAMQSDHGPRPRRLGIEATEPRDIPLGRAIVAKPPAAAGERPLGGAGGEVIGFERRGD